MPVMKVDFEPTDRVAKARATRRRYADDRLAEQLRGRGWLCLPPEVAQELAGQLDARREAVGVGRRPLGREDE